MRLIKMFGLTALAVGVVTAFVGGTSASAETNTQLCSTHSGLTCSSGVSSSHMVLSTGTVIVLQSPINILCLGGLIEASALALSHTQSIHNDTVSLTGCGTGSFHNNCTLSITQLPLAGLLKTGLDEGVLRYLSGQLQLQCPNLGLNCLYDLEGIEFAVGAGHLTAEESVFGEELGGKFLCPDESLLSALLETLTDTYVLG